MGPCWPIIARRALGAASPKSHCAAAAVLRTCLLQQRQLIFASVLFAAALLAAHFLCFCVCSCCCQNCHTSFPVALPWLNFRSFISYNESLQQGNRRYPTFTPSCASFPTAPPHHLGPIPASSVWPAFSCYLAAHPSTFSCRSAVVLRVVDLQAAMLQHL